MTRFMATITNTLTSGKTNISTQMQNYGTTGNQEIKVLWPKSKKTNKNHIVI